MSALEPTSTPRVGSSESEGPSLPRSIARRYPLLVSAAEQRDAALRIGRTNIVTPDNPGRLSFISIESAQHRQFRARRIQRVGPPLYISSGGDNDFDSAVPVLRSGGMTRPRASWRSRSAPDVKIDVVQRQCAGKGLAQTRDGQERLIAWNRLQKTLDGSLRCAMLLRSRRRRHAAVLLDAPIRRDSAPCSGSKE